MTTKTKGRDGCNRPTPKTSDNCDSTRTDPRKGWILSANSSRIARWQRPGPQRLSAVMKAKAKETIVRLAVWGVIPASLVTWLIQCGGLKDA